MQGWALRRNDDIRPGPHILKRSILNPTPDNETGHTVVVVVKSGTVAERETVERFFEMGFRIVLSCTDGKVYAG